MVCMLKIVSGNNKASVVIVDDHSHMEYGKITRLPKQSRPKQCCRWIQANLASRASIPFKKVILRKIFKK